MVVKVTEEFLSKIIHSALSSFNGVEKLREYVFDYYYNEREYIFENSLNDLFDVLSVYLLWEEAQGDDLRRLKLSRVAFILDKIEYSKERLIGALYYDDIKVLQNKHKHNVIDDMVYRKQLTKLCPIEYNVKKLLNFINTEYRGQI